MYLHSEQQTICYCLGNGGGGCSLLRLLGTPISPNDHYCFVLRTFGEPLRFWELWYKRTYTGILYDEKCRESKIQINQNSSSSKAIYHPSTLAIFVYKKVLNPIRHTNNRSRFITYPSWKTSFIGYNPANSVIDWLTDMEGVVDIGLSFSFIKTQHWWLHPSEFIVGYERYRRVCSWDERYRLSERMR